MGANLASHWLNTDYADAEARVLLHTLGSTSGEGMLVVRLPVHRLILTAASPYFAALFERWARAATAAPTSHGLCATAANSTGCGCRPPAPCTLHVTHWEDVDAAVCLLRCCYTGEFDVSACASVDSVLQQAATSSDALAQRPACTQPRCWQQLAVRTLVLADRLDCAAVAESCVEVLSGRLFAHQMEWDCAMAVLWLLPEPLAHQQVVEPLTHMAHVRVVQEYGDLEPALANPVEIARLQRLPAEALALLLLSPDLRVWGEGAALAAVHIWSAGPVGRAATEEQLATIGRAVRLPLVTGPLLAAAALVMPRATFAAWPLEEMEKYYSSSLDERYNMTHARLEASQDVPWSAVRRQRTAADDLATIRSSVHLSQIRRLHEQAVAAAEAAAAADSARGSAKAAATAAPGLAQVWGCGLSGDADGDGPSLLLGCASFGGYTWSISLVCCLQQGPEAAEGDAHGEQGEGEAAAQEEAGEQVPPPLGRMGAHGALSWRLGLRVMASPLIGRHPRQDSGGNDEGMAVDDSPGFDCGQQLQGVGHGGMEGGSNSVVGGEAHGNGLGGPGGARLAPWQEDLLSIGSSRAAAAMGRLGGSAQDAAAAAGGATPVAAASSVSAPAAAAFDVAAGVCVEVVEHGTLLGDAAPAGPFKALMLRGSCGQWGRQKTSGWCCAWQAAGRQGGSAGGAGGAAACGFCRHGTLGDAFGGGRDGEGPVFQGWQPERWSALAPGGRLHWRCALRLLTDY